MRKDGIRVLIRSRGYGDVCKGQSKDFCAVRVPRAEKSNNIGTFGKNIGEGGRVCR